MTRVSNPVAWPISIQYLQVCCWRQSHRESPALALQAVLKRARCGVLEALTEVVGREAGPPRGILSRRNAHARPAGTEVVQDRRRWPGAHPRYAEMQGVGERGEGAHPRRWPP